MAEKTLIEKMLLYMVCFLHSIGLLILKNIVPSQIQQERNSKVTKL